MNNRQRRAAKARRRRKQRTQSGPRSARDGGAGSFGYNPTSSEAFQRDQAQDLADLHLRRTVRRLARKPAKPEVRHHLTRLLLSQVGPGSAEIVGEVLGDLLVALADEMANGGWHPTDLAELVGRVDESWLTVLAQALHEHARDQRRGRDDQVWRAAVEAIAPESRLALPDFDDLNTALHLAGLLASAPLLDERTYAAVGGANRRSRPQRQPPRWNQVRALLAKAESTDFGPEAESLVAKAQELITRYALERLVEAEQDETSHAETPMPRRLWLNRPYVRAKGILVDEVALANHCRSALAESFGFSLLIGHQADLDAVDMLVTSLLVQADAAMMRLGRTAGQPGSRARSRSFRQSFLIAYALRIGERMHAAGEAAVADHSSLLPALANQDARVADSFEAMVPHTLGRAANISDYAGWDAGQIAADQALLDVNGKLSPA